MILPGTDGVNHINIYSKGKTELGRWMSNFDGSQSIETVDGIFQSIEGYWYWLGSRDEGLRNLSGYAAKQYGKTCKQTQRLSTEDFQNKIIRALQNKFMQASVEKQSLFKNSILPFCHYYEYGNTKKDAGYEWIVEYWEKLRRTKMILSTSQYNYSGPGRLDITVKTGEKIFAPSWNMVFGVKNGILSTTDYTEMYRQMMRESYKNNTARWLEVLSQPEVTLVCFCKPGEFCHRMLLASFLCAVAEKRGISVEWRGET